MATTPERPPLDLVIIGAPKAGTTSLAQWLAKHPNAFMPHEKEISYFDLNYHRGRAWLDQRFAKSGDAIRIDATPAYLYVDEALERMARDAPNARLVVLLREPVDRVWSHFWYNRSTGLDFRPFNWILRAETRDPTNAPHNLPIGYLACSRYMQRLDRYMEHFDREQLLVLFFDDLRADPHDVWKRVLQHAGLPHVELPEERKKYFPGKRPKSAILQHLLLRSGPGRWPRGWGTKLFMANARKGGYPSLTDKQRAKLTALLDGETRKLDAWLPGEVPPSWPR